MKKIILILFFASVFVQTQVETRTLNNGNLILEDVPNVPEEINRKVVDHLADFNLVYTEHARRNLLSEGFR